VAEVRHRRLDANPCLTGVGEDRQQGDGLGVQVHGLDPIGLQDRQEEGGEWWHQAGEDGEEEEGMRRRGQSVPRRTAMLDASGAPLAVLAPDHLSDGLELAAALDAGVEQGRRRLRRRLRRPRCSGGPARCHGSGRGRVAAGGSKATFPKV
jgi:hypothetical protein